MADFEHLQTASTDVPYVDGIVPVDILTLPVEVGIIVRGMVRDRAIKSVEFAGALGISDNDALSAAEILVKKGPLLVVEDNAAMLRLIPATEMPTGCRRIASALRGCANSTYHLTYDHWWTLEQALSIHEHSKKSDPTFSPLRLAAGHQRLLSGRLHGYSAPYASRTDLGRRSQCGNLPGGPAESKRRLRLTLPARRRNGNGGGYRRFRRRKA